MESGEASFTEEVDSFELEAVLQLLRVRVRLRIDQVNKPGSKWLGTTDRHVITVSGPAQAVADAKRELDDWLTRDRADRSTW
jgi:hypothetical protein